LITWSRRDEVPSMFWIWTILGVVGFLFLSWVYMRRCRRRLFQRVAATRAEAMPVLAARMDEHLKVAAEMPFSLRLSSNREEMEKLIDQDGFRLGQHFDALIKRTYGYMAYDKLDPEAVIIASGAYIGEMAIKLHGGIWLDGGEHGPGVRIGDEVNHVLFHPVEKCAAHQEFGEPGDLAAYVAFILRRDAISKAQEQISQ